MTCLQYFPVIIANLQEAYTSEIPENIKEMLLGNDGGYSIL